MRIEYSTIADMSRFFMLHSEECVIFFQNSKGNWKEKESKRERKITDKGFDGRRRGRPPSGTPIEGESSPHSRTIFGKTLDTG
jgi:hypothetical protein